MVILGASLRELGYGRPLPGTQCRGFVCGKGGSSDTLVNRYSSLIHFFFTPGFALRLFRIVVFRCYAKAWTPEGPVGGPPADDNYEGASLRLDAEPKPVSEPPLNKLVLLSVWPGDL